FIYIDDLVNAVALAAQKIGVGGEIFQIATNRETTVSELLNLLILKLGESGINCPKVIYGDSRNGDVRRNYSNTSKAKRLLGWTASVPLDDGLLATIRSFL
ncbi:MAG: NAD-dependent epimerase/dehydratase family protein, partial [Minisyncoccia bacterium]